MALLGNLTGSSHLNFQDSTDFYNGVATQSVRLDDGSSAYFAFTPDSASSAVDRRKVTHSFWVKRGNVTTSQTLYSANENGVDDYYLFRFNSDNKILIVLDVNDSNFGYETSAVFRDTSAWYNIVLIIDTTQGTNTNRVKLYVNGVLQAIATKYSGGHVSQNFSTYVMDGNEDEIGRFAYNDSTPFDGYMSEVITTIGQNNTIDEFGELKNGVWIPINYAGSFGTNGFRLKFDQLGVGTASTSTIGADTSGNTNHWTSSGIVASDCAMPDSPENNFCTWNPLTSGAQTTFAEGNLKLATVWSADLSGSASTFFPESGKWYWELRIDGAGTYPYIGITSQEKVNDTVNGGTFYNIAWHAGGTSQGTGSSLGTITKENIPSFADDDIMSFALDVDARKIWVAENNTYADSGDPANGSGENASWTLDVGISPFISGYQSQGVGTIANFGQDDTFGGAISSAGNTDGNGKGVFKYAPPSGFLSLCTSNLPEPTIGANSLTQADDYFNTVLYTGASSGQGITGVGFQPDWTWIKSRSHASSHVLTDSSRGVTESLFSDTAAAESTLSGGVTAFGTDGFTLGTEGTVNTDTRTYVAWNWKANGGTATATITESGNNPAASVQANPTAGFSIITYTGTGAAGTIAHGLGAVPKMIICKNRNNGDDNAYWAVYHGENTTAPATDYLVLNTTAATADGDGFWNDTAPTSSVFTVNSNNTLNRDGYLHVAYVFAEVEGYSKFGSYTGNGNADGTFVYTGFRPAFIMFKTTTIVSHWTIVDNARSTYNVVDDSLYTDTSAAELTTITDVDFLSNGFKWRGVLANETNVSGQVYIYMAFAEAPFKYANAK